LYPDRYATHMDGTARSGRVGHLLEEARVNTLLAWLLVGFVSITALGSALRGQLLWAGFALAIAVLAVVPPVAYRDVGVMLPWEVLALGALPVLARALATTLPTARVAAYLSVAALALVVAVELHVFTTVRMTAWFAVVFVVVATMATAGVWAIVQWLSDVYLGTAFIPSEEALMWDFVAATAAGVVAGVVFDRYFRRRARAERRLPDEVEEAVQ
jgi:hypothetical protein